MNRDLDEQDDAVSYDSQTDRYAVDFDEASIPPSSAVVEAVARASDADVDELDSLYEYVDPESLDGICEDAGKNGDCIVQFTYVDHLVTVKRSGLVEVEPMASES